MLPTTTPDYLAHVIVYKQDSTQGYDILESSDPGTVTASPREALENLLGSLQLQLKM
jgi:hypothetical protein